MVECTLWERDVAGSSPVSPITEEVMNDTDKLRLIIATTATIIFVVFALILVRPKEVSELQSGDIQHAIETGQY